MLSERNEIKLKKGSDFVPQDPGKAFLVGEGRVFVYVIPWKDGGPGRRILLREAGKGDRIPSFCYRDKEYTSWRFLISAAEDTCIVREDRFSENAAAEFLKGAGIPDFPAEGPKEALVNFYRMNLVREDGYFLRTEMERSEVGKKTEELIGRAVSGRQEHVSSGGGSVCIKKKISRRFPAECADGIRRADLILFFLLTVCFSAFCLLGPVCLRKFAEGSALKNAGTVLSVLFLPAVMFVLLFFRNETAARMENSAGENMQTGFYKRMFSLPEEFMRRYERSEITERILEAGDAAGEVTGMFAGMAEGIAGTACCLIFLCFEDMRLMLPVLLFLVLLFSGAAMLSGVYAAYDSGITAQEERRYSRLLQFTDAVEKIRMSGTESRAVYEYMKPFTGKMTLAGKKERAGTFYRIFVFLSACMTFFRLLYECLKPGSVTRGETAAFLSAFVLLIIFSAAFSEHFLGYMSFRPSFGRYLEILDCSDVTAEDKPAQGKAEGSMEAEHLCFSYQDDKTEILHDFSLSVRGGEYLGIAGASGSGKSTLLKLLMGLEKPDAGKIFCDGEDLCETDLRGLRRRFGTVLQDAGIAAGAVYDNIVLTHPDAGAEDILRVLKETGLDRDLETMPMGLDTLLDENAETVSGGQKQKILLARALIGNPEILFLDEATGSLDADAQSTVLNTLSGMRCTRIVTAHRLETLRGCDRILVMDHGKAVEEGTFEELTKGSGIFRKMWEEQTV